MRSLLPVAMRVRHAGLLLLLAGLLLAAWPQHGVAAEPLAATDRPVREIFVPVADLDVLIGGDAQRVFVTREEYQDLLSRARLPEPETPPPREVVVLAADYQVVLAGERAVIQGRLQLEVLEPGLHVVSIPLEGVGLQTATLDGGSAVLGRDQAGMPQLFIEGRGRHELSLDLTMPVVTSAAQQAVSFRVPTPAATRIRVSVPGNVEIRSGVLSRVFDQVAAVTRFEVPPARGTQQLVMSLNNRTRALQRVVSARSVLVDEVTQGYRRLHATMSMQVLRGGAPSFAFRLPNDLEVTDVVAPQVAQWRVREENNERVLEVQLHEQATDRVTLAITAAGTRPSPGPWTLTQIEPLDVVGHVAVLGLLLDERLDAEQLAAEKAFPIDVSVLRQAVPASVFVADPSAPQIRPVAAWLAAENGSVISAELIRPDAAVDVKVATLLSLDEDAQRLRSTVTLRPQAEPIKAVTLEIPNDWEVTAVLAADGSPLAFTPAIGQDTPGVRVRFPVQVAESTATSFTVQAESVPAGWLAQWSEQAVEFPILRIRGGTFLEGAVAVTATGDLAVRPEELDGLIPLARREREEVGLAADEGTFAYRLLSAEHAAEFAVERRQPRITARTFTFARIGNEAVTTHAEVLYDIERAATRTLSFRLPLDTPPLISLRGLAGVEVSEFSSREVDGSRLWTAQLADRSRGTAGLAIDFQQPLTLGEQPIDLPLPCIEADGVDYQSAAVAVEGNPEIDVTLASGGRPIDAGELVDAEYQVGRRLLGVYGFVGTAEVSAAVTRRAGYALPEAITQRVELLTLQGTAGVAQTAARYELRTNAAFLQVTLPAGAALWSVSIDGRPSLPQRDGDAVLVSLPPSGDGAAIRDISIVYETEQSASVWLHEVAHESPQLAVRDQAGPVVDVPVADVVWQLVVPDGMRVVRSGGSVEVPGGGGEPWPLTDLAGVLVPMGGGVRAFSWMPLMESALPQAEMPALVATSSRRGDADSDFGIAEGDEMSAAEDTPFPAATPVLPPVIAGKVDRLIAEPQSQLGVAGRSSLAASDEQMPSDNALAFSGVAGQPATAAPQSASGPQPQMQGEAAFGTQATTWAFEGVRSLPIALDDYGRTYRYESLGGETRLAVTLADESRLTSAAGGLAAAVVFCGCLLVRRRWKTRLFMLTLVLVAAVGIPTAVELTLGLDLHAFFEPACLAVVGLLPVFLVVDAAGIVRRGGVSAPAPQAVALLAMVLLGSGPSGVCLAQETSGADADISEVRLGDLLDLLAPTQPVGIPDDAVVIPYDPEQVGSATDADTVDADKVLVPYAEYTRLKKLADELTAGQHAGQRAAAPPAPFAFGAVRYTTRLEERGDLVVTGSVEVMVYAKGVVEVPLMLSGGVFASAQLDERTARLRLVEPEVVNTPQQQVAQPMQAEPPVVFLVAVEGEGRHQLTLDIRFAPTQRGGWRRVEGRLPAGPATAVALRVPGADTEVRLSGVHDQVAWETTRPEEEIETALVDQGQFSLEWRSRVAAATIDEALTVSSLGILDVREDGIQLAWQLALDIRQGQRDAWRFVVPADVLVEEVRGANVRGWETSQREGRQQIDVTLLEPATGQAELLVRLSKSSNLVFARDEEVSLPFVSVPEAALHQGGIVIRRGPLVDLRVAEVRGLARDEAPQEKMAAVLSEVSDESPLPLRSFQAYRFATENVDLRLTAGGAQSQVDVDGQMILRIAAGETAFETQLNCTIESRPVHAVEIRLPADVELETVAAPGLSNWSLADDGQLLRLDLADGAIGQLPVTLRGQLPAVEMTGPADAETGSVLPPAFIVENTRRQSGMVVVQVDPSMSVEVRDLVDAEVVPLTRALSWLAEAQRPLARLAFVHRAGAFSARLQVAQRVPVVSAVAVTNVRITPRDIEETMLVRFQIREAGIREVAFLVPESLADADVEVPLLLEKRVEPVAEMPGLVRMQLTLQDDVMGSLAVLVQASRALPSGGYRVPMASIETGTTLQRYAVLETGGRDEVVVSANTGFREVNRQAAEWRELASILPGQTTMAYVARSDEAAPELELSLRERALVETAGARIGLAVTILSVDAHGEYRGSQEYRVDNKTEQLLEVELPAGATLWSAMVAGESVKPTPLAGDADRRQVGIPLMKTQAGDLDYGVVLKYGGNLGQIESLQTVGFPLMTTLNINVEQSQVRLRLPESYRWFDFGGTLRQTDSADDLVADFVAYQNKKLEQLLQVASSETNDVFSRVRASTNARQLGESLQGYRDAYRGSSRSQGVNDKLQKALEFNALIAEEAESQAPPVAAGVERGLALGNGSQLRSYFSQQDVQRGQNVVNELAKNFDVSGAVEGGDVAEKAREQETEERFNRRWLSENRFGRSDELGDAEDRAAGELSQAKEGRLGDVRGKRAVSFSDDAPLTADFKSLNENLGVEQEVEISKKKELSKQPQEVQLFDQVQRYQQRLERQGRDQAASVAAPTGGAARERQFAEQGEGQQSGLQGGEALDLARGGMGGMGGGGGLGGGFGGRQLSNDVNANGPASGLDDSLQRLAESSGEMRSQDWEVLPPQRQAQGLASLDVDMPQRGEEFLFTTPRGDLEITARAVDARLVDRGLRLATVLAGIAAVWLVWGLAAATWGRLGIQLGGVLLLLTGLLSLVTLVLPVLGLVAAAVGGTLVVATVRQRWFAAA